MRPSSKANLRSLGALLLYLAAFACHSYARTSNALNWGLVIQGTPLCRSIASEYPCIGVLLYS